MTNLRATTALNGKFLSSEQQELIKKELNYTQNQSTNYTENQSTFNSRTPEFYRRSIISDQYFLKFYLYLLENKKDNEEYCNLQKQINDIFQNENLTLAQKEIFAYGYYFFTAISTLIDNKKIDLATKLLKIVANTNLNQEQEKILSYWNFNTMICMLTFYECTEVVEKLLDIVNNENFNRETCQALYTQIDLLHSNTGHFKNELTINTEKDVSKDLVNKAIDAFSKNIYKFTTPNTQLSDSKQSETLTEEITRSK